MRFVLLALFVSGAAFAQTSEMYRSINADGTVTFSDRPQGDDYELVAVITSAGVRAPAPQAPRAAPPPAPELELTPGASADELRQQLAQSCRLAREQLNALMVSDRLYRVLPSGETEYLNDAELTTARDAARAQVTRWCD